MVLREKAPPELESPVRLQNRSDTLGCTLAVRAISGRDPILVPSPSMVVLILTVESIARFPELKERFAEYLLIGTVLSIGLAVLVG